MARTFCSHRFCLPCARTHLLYFWSPRHDHCSRHAGFMYYMPLHAARRSVYHILLPAARRATAHMLRALRGSCAQFYYLPAARVPTVRYCLPGILRFRSQTATTYRRYACLPPPVLATCTPAMRTCRSVHYTGSFCRTPSCLPSPQPPRAAHVLRLRRRRVCLLRTHLPYYTATAVPFYSAFYSPATHCNASTCGSSSPAVCIPYTCCFVWFWYCAACCQRKEILPVCSGCYTRTACLCSFCISCYYAVASVLYTYNLSAFSPLLPVPHHAPVQPSVTYSYCSAAVQFSIILLHTLYYQRFYHHRSFTT